MNNLNQKRGYQPYQKQIDQEQYRQLEENKKEQEDINAREQEIKEQQKRENILSQEARDRELRAITLAISALLLEIRKYITCPNEAQQLLNKVNSNTYMSPSQLYVTNTMVKRHIEEQKHRQGRIVC